MDGIFLGEISGIIDPEGNPRLNEGRRSSSKFRGPCCGGKRWRPPCFRLGLGLFFDPLSFSALLAVIGEDPQERIGTARRKKTLEATER